MTQALLFLVAIGMVVYGLYPVALRALVSKTQRPVEITRVATMSSLIQQEAVGELVRVDRVIDGDTIELVDKRKVRYIGINAPELHDPKRPVGCFGQEAADANKKLVEGKAVRLVKDVSETDKYGRLLRYVYIDPPARLDSASLAARRAKRDGEASDVFVNDWMVRQGFASVSTYPPDVRYRDQFQDAAAEARRENRGLWKSCQVK